MDLNQLEIFVNVIDNKSFTKTAKQLFITQPTVSAHVASLERELNVQLVVRTTKEVAPSEQGEILYEYARQMLTLRDSAIQAVKGRTGVMEGCITIGASTVPSQYFLPELMAAFSAQHPRISFQVTRMDSAQVLENLLDWRIDIGMSGVMFPGTKCVYTPFASDRLVIITPNTPAFQEIADGKFPLSRLLREPLILREAGSGTRRNAEEFLQVSGIDLASLNIVAEIADPESIKKSVSQGLGVSIVSDRSVTDDRQFGKILAFEPEPPCPPRRLYLLRHKTRHFSPAANAFYQFASEYFPK